LTPSVRPFNNDIVRGLRRRAPDLDIVRIQDFGLSGADDPTVLAWCAAENRVLLSHDVRTLAGFAYERASSGLPMPGIFEVGRSLSMSRVIDDLWVLAEASIDGEWDAQVRFLPI
jgi:hypothetical protein